MSEIDSERKEQKSVQNRNQNGNKTCKENKIYTQIKSKNK